MKILVTGATGFIGNYLIPELLSRDFEVVASSRHPEKAQKTDWLNRVEFVEHDMETVSTENLFEKFHRPDLLIHLAWGKLSDFKDNAHISEILPRHKLFLHNLLSNGLKNITVAGTCLEYGMTEGELNETSEGKPIVAYAIAKNELRLYLEQLKAQISFSLKWLRLFYIYGEGQNSKSIIPQLQKSLRNKEEVFNMSLGEQIRDYLPVQTLVKDIVTFAIQIKYEGIINCSSNQPITIKQLVLNYLIKENKTIKINFGFYPYNDYEPFGFWGGNEKQQKIKTMAASESDKTEFPEELKNSSEGFHQLFLQKKVPLFQNKVYKNQEIALKAGFGDVKLVQSKVSGFVFNQDFDGSLMDYDENYHNEQSNSPFFKNHQQNVFALLDGFGLKAKSIVEIGCGKGDFFEILKSHQLSCVGFDPSYEGNDPSIVKDYFSEKHKIQADLVILRHTLEHIENPHQFIQQIAKINNRAGYIFIEVPTFDWIINKNAFWDVFYEHSNYFSIQSLTSMFSKSQSGYLFGGQYIYCYAKLSDLRETIPQQDFVPYDTKAFLGEFEKWSKFISSGKNIAIWGAGAKGSTFLNLIDPQKKFIKAVIDVNPNKQNKFIAVTGHPILAPEKLTEINCDHLIVMNENYMNEIKKTVSDLKITKINILSL